LKKIKETLLTKVPTHPRTEDKNYKTYQNTISKELRSRLKKIKEREKEK
jgi:hypothetical protein